MPSMYHRAQEIIWHTMYVNKFILTNVNWWNFHRINSRIFTCVTVWVLRHNATN